MKKDQEWKERVLKRKWESLKARGIKRPVSKEDNDKRAHEAHGY